MRRSWFSKEVYLLFEGGTSCGHRLYSSFRYRKWEKQLERGTGINERLMKDTTWLH